MVIKVRIIVYLNRDVDQRNVGSTISSAPSEGALLTEPIKRELTLVVSQCRLASVSELVLREFDVRKLLSAMPYHIPYTIAIQYQWQLGISEFYVRVYVYVGVDVCRDTLNGSSGKNGGGGSFGSRWKNEKRGEAAFAFAYTYYPHLSSVLQCRRAASASESLFPFFLLLTCDFTPTIVLYALPILPPLRHVFFSHSSYKIIIIVIVGSLVIVTIITIVVVSQCLGNSFKSPTMLFTSHELSAQTRLTMSIILLQFAD